MFREPTLRRHKDESAKQSFTHHFQDGRGLRAPQPCASGSFWEFLILLFRLFQILESRERSDPASGENADGAIIVSHLVSLFILLPLGGGGLVVVVGGGRVRVTLLVHKQLSVK